MPDVDHVLRRSFLSAAFDVQYSQERGSCRFLRVATASKFKPAIAQSKRVVEVNGNNLL